jgi:low affinity Fe/Cu permease
MLVVVLWVPTLWVLPSVDTWQLVIHTVTTIITFLLVALPLQFIRKWGDAVVKEGTVKSQCARSSGYRML